MKLTSPLKAPRRGSIRSADPVGVHVARDLAETIRQLAIEAEVRLRVVREFAEPGERTAMVIATGRSVHGLGEVKNRRLILVAPESMEEKAAEAILGQAKMVELILPGFDEDGRCRFWRRAAGDRNDESGGQIVLAGVGNQVEWAWDNIIATIREVLDKQELALESRPVP
jgi:hypothetical protein